MARRGGGWAQPTRPLPGNARQRACSGAGAFGPGHRTPPRLQKDGGAPGAAAFVGRGAFGPPAHKQREGGRG